MPRTFQVFNTLSEFYASLGGHIAQDADFTVHRFADLHPEVPYTSPLFRVNYYTIALIYCGRPSVLSRELPQELLVRLRS
ncbi:MAG: hypothetical protein ACFB5Z_19905 [Elainellaceae cyanobacterium]